MSGTGLNTTYLSNGETIRIIFKVLVLKPRASHVMRSVG